MSTFCRRPKLVLLGHLIFARFSCIVTCACGRPFIHSFIHSPMWKCRTAPKPRQTAVITKSPDDLPIARLTTKKDKS